MSNQNNAPVVPYGEWGQMVPNYPQPSYQQRTWLVVPSYLSYGVDPQYGAAPPQFPDVAAVMPPTVPYAGTSGASPRVQTGGVLPRGQDVTGYYANLVPPRVPTAGDPFSY